MRRLTSLVLTLTLCLAPIASAQQRTVNTYIAPFQSGSAEEAEIGKKVAIILNLQVWQTLRIPPTGSGRSTKGTVIWDVTSKPPATYPEANALAKSAQPDEPQIVLWGKAWHYVNQNVAEAFLLIRRDVERNPAGKAIWKASLPNGPTFSVDVPHWQVDFAPIVLRADLLAELKDPAGLKLFADSRGTSVNGYVGDTFRALEQDREAAKVVTPDGRTGWVRLPELSKNPSEVVHFTGGLVRIFRQDWDGASQLFQRVVNNPHAPLSVRVDAYLYLAICADQMSGDSYQWVRKAYELDPLSKAVIQYLCMSHFSAIARQKAGAENSNRTDRLRLLNEIAQQSKPLFPPQDPWFTKLTQYLEGAR